MKYYSLLLAWHKDSDNNFHFVNSHDKAASVRDTSRRATLRNVLAERLRNSKNMVLILGQTTRFDTDWVPFEISYAVDSCAIPIIAAYPGYDSIQGPAELAPFWPLALAERIQSGAARVIHIPFRQAPLTDAVSQFTHEAPPNGSLSYYSRDAYASFGINIP